MITRIRALLEARQLSPTQFADLIGVGRPVISHILSERNKPSLEVVQKIISAFPDISMSWLLAGTGPMLVTAAGAGSDAPAVASSLVPTAATPPTVPPPTRPAPFERPAPIAAHPSSYPPPSKFRPGAIAATAPASFIMASSPASTPAPVADASPVAASPSQAPYSTPAAAPSMSSPLLPAESLGDAAPPVLPTAEAPLATTSELDAPPPHPAAALSFLGEPGKAIRRIVIFYRDGSFSDYLPEGN